MDAAPDKALTASSRPRSSRHQIGQNGIFVAFGFFLPPDTHTRTHTHRGSVVEWNSCRGEQMLPPSRFVANKTNQATPEAPTLPQPRVFAWFSDQVDRSTSIHPWRRRPFPSRPFPVEDSDCSATPLNSIDKRK